MNNAIQTFESQYALVLRGHIDGGGEATLHEAYELGRAALASGVGVLEMATLRTRPSWRSAGKPACPTARANHPGRGRLCAGVDLPVRDGTTAE